MIEIRRQLNQVWNFIIRKLRRFWRWCRNQPCFWISISVLVAAVLVGIYLQPIVYQQHDKIPSQEDKNKKHCQLKKRVLSNGLDPTSVIECLEKHQTSKWTLLNIIGDVEKALNEYIFVQRNQCPHESIDKEPNNVRQDLKKLKKRVSKCDDYCNTYDFIHNLTSLINRNNDGHLKILSLTNGTHHIFPEITRIKYKLDKDFMEIFEESESINGIEKTEWLKSVAVEKSSYKTMNNMVTDVAKKIDSGGIWSGFLSRKELKDGLIRIYEKKRLFRNSTMKQTNNKYIFRSRKPEKVSDDPLMKKIKKMEIHYEDIFGCSYSKKEGMNTIIIHSFINDKVNKTNKGEYQQMISKYSDAINECGKIIRSNTDPIQIILNSNGGGLVRFVLLLLENLNDYQSFVTINDYLNTGATKQKVLKKYLLEENCNYSDPDKQNNCIQKYEFILQNKTKLNLCANTSMYLSNLEIRINKGDNGNYVLYPRRLYVYVDPFCFSACSIFVNMIHKYRMGSIIGLTEFDEKTFGGMTIGTSPSAVVKNKEYFYGKEEKRQPMYAEMRFPFTEFYNDDIVLNNRKVEPGEFKKIDPSITINTRWKEWGLKEYTETTKQYFKSMRNDTCDPRLHNVIMIDSNCTSEQGGWIGGYECGRNSKWNRTRCVHLYCAKGRQVNKERSGCIDVVRAK